MRKSLPLFLAVCSLIIPTCALAWGGAGHQVIAAEAYRELTPELKAETFAVLQAHPDFAKWTNSYRPNANFDLAAYMFMRSSTWPDEIRRSGNKYDHPTGILLITLSGLQPSRWNRMRGQRTTSCLAFRSVRRP